MSLSNKIKIFLATQKITLIHHEILGSTMKEIRKYIGDKNICIIADEQTLGIGRRGNKWISPKGNIYLSFLFDCKLSPKEHFLFTAITANSIIRCLKYFISENIKIKWPNDIIINDNKIAGIMTDLIIQNNKKYIILGIGINISNSPIITDYKTCCLNDFNPTIKHDEILLSFLETFFSEYDLILKKEYKKIIEKFKNNMKNLGEKTLLLLPSGKKQNVILKNLNFDGSLLIEKNKKEENIFSARIIDDIN